jgi:hypothetical protein
LEPIGPIDLAVPKVKGVVMGLNIFLAKDAAFGA